MIPIPVLLILLDDCGQELIDASPTPNLDALAAESVSFDVCWSAPKCSAARARIFSGLEAWRPENLVGSNIGPKAKYSLPAGSSFVNSLPGNSSLHGKLHLTPVSYETWPLAAGFYFWNGSMGNLNTHGKGTGFYDWERVTPGGSSMEHRYATQVVGNSALFSFGVDNLIVVSIHDPHVPLDVPPQALSPVSHLGTTPIDTTEEKVKAKVEALDTVVGWLVNQAKIHDYAVIVLSDNSSPSDFGFGGAKGELSNKGLDVPHWMYHPSWSPGKRSGMIQSTDIAATIQALRGASASPPTDSVSFLDALNDAAGEAPRTFIRSDQFGPNGEPPGDNWERAIRDASWSYYDRKEGEALYNLEIDPEEKSNLWPPSTQEEIEAHARLMANIQG